MGGAGAAPGPRQLRSPPVVHGFPWHGEGASRIAATATTNEPRINDRIRAREVRVVHEGEQLGIKPLPEALALAADGGADLTVRPGDGAAADIRAATGGRGADVVLDFVGSDDTLALGAAVGRSLGDLTLVGLAGGSLRMSFFSVPYELSVQSTYWGSRPELVEVLELGARRLLRPTITTVSLEQALDAYRRMEDGSAVGRQVVVPNPA